MRIKLICPTSYDLDNKLIKVRQATLPPLSILYLAGLTPKKHDVEVLDECVQAIDFDETVDLVGITCMTFTAKRAYQIADAFRERHVKVVMGGIHASSSVEEALEHADSVVIGEADDLWPKVLQDASNGNLEKTYTSKKRDSIDNLPRPMFELLDATKYIRLPFRRSPIIPIQSARGCPFDCEFCSVSRFWGKKVRFRPIRDVIEEISTSHADTLFFTDDNFIANAQRTLELCEALTPLGIKYICQIDSLAFRHPEIIEALKKSGCFMAFVGFESIYKNNLENVNKAFNEPDNYAKLIKMLHRNKISVYASIIFGFERDDPGKVRETVKFLIDEKVSLASFFRLTPFPGTRLFERLDQQGVLTDRKWWLKRGGGLGALIKYPDNPHTGEELTSMAMKYFYSWQSILKRFFPAKGFSLDVLPLNLQAYKRVRKYHKTTIL
ncbi:MAG: B12-binding domain-containing radical SAM protein [Deltaproteobacteria bacterium]|nr:MAG: B12-binding domain-containing radical SAM protein [Deltaproteobacteria bacterium]